MVGGEIYRRKKLLIISMKTGRIKNKCTREYEICVYATEANKKSEKKKGKKKKNKYK